MEKLPSGAYEPLLSEARRTASTDGITVLNLPICSHGFRNGEATVERGGQSFRVHHSTPDRMDYSDAKAICAKDAAFAFAIADLRAAGFPENRG